MGIMETWIRADNAGLLHRFHKTWGTDSNIGMARNIRIVILWKENLVEVNVVQKDAQFLHCYIKQKGSQFCGFITFIYASNNGSERQQLWQQLQHISEHMTEPWLLVGDFNVVLNAIEKQREDGSVSDPGTELEEFFLNAKLQDLRGYGCHFTWTNSHVSCKLDRAVANDSWFQQLDSSAHFHASGMSDHSPIQVTMGQELHIRKRDVSLQDIMG